MNLAIISEIFFLFQVEIMGNCSSSSVKLLLLSVLVSTRCFTGGNLNYSLIKVSDTTVIDSLTRGCHILFNSQTSLAREEFKFLEEIHQLAHPKALSMGVVDFHEFSLGEKFHLVVEDQQGHSIEIGNLPHYDYILLR